MTVDRFNVDPAFTTDVFVKCIAEIRKKETGEIHNVDTNVFIDDDGHASPYIWRDGNFSCDCNRDIFFLGSMSDNEKAHPCGEGKYSVNLKSEKTGEYFYKEY